MKLHDIHFCFGFVMGRRDKHFKDFILSVCSKFNEDKDYSRQEIQRILYKYSIWTYILAGRYYVEDFNKVDFKSKERCFRFIKHTIRSHKNY